MAKYPDYRTIPDNILDPKLTPEQYALSLEWGNLHDGCDGRYIPMYPNGDAVQTDDDGFAFGCGSAKYPCTPSQERFERWWRRNPRHNATMVVNRRPVRNPTYYIGNPAPQPFPYEMNKVLVLRTNPFFIKIGYFIRGYRSDKPRWPAPQHWLDRDPTLGPPETHGYGGALDTGFKSYEYP